MHSDIDIGQNDTKVAYIMMRYLLRDSYLLEFEMKKHLKITYKSVW